MADTIPKPKPEFRNIGIAQLRRYRLPLAGKVSILHRLSGGLLFLLLPFALYLFEQSLTSEQNFANLKTFFAHTIVKLIVLVLAWAFCFHFFAGLRFLLADVHKYVSKEGGRKSAGVVLALSSVLTVLIAVKLFGGV